MGLSGAWTQPKPKGVNKAMIRQSLAALYRSYRPRFMDAKEMAEFKHTIVDLELWWKDLGGKVKDFQAEQKKYVRKNANRKLSVGHKAAKNRKLYRAKYGRR